MRNLFKKYEINGSLKYAAFNEYGQNLEAFIDEMTTLGKDVVVKLV